MVDGCSLGIRREHNGVHKLQDGANYGANTFREKGNNRFNERVKIHGQNINTSPKRFHAFAD